MRDMLTKVDSLTVELFNERGEIMPTWVTIDEAGAYSVVPTPFGNPQSKDVVAVVMRRLFAKYGVVRYILATEAWMVKRGKDDLTDGVVPSQAPDRIEVLIYEGEDRNGDHIHASRSITRMESGIPILGELVISNDITASGRFTGLFQEAKQ